ncbi:MAG: hypothetical protein KF835_15680 [Xanthobacteraceae bacterium]|nr:hypothetical protein [Xanthobacteraceae bacterium]
MKKFIIAALAAIALMNFPTAASARVASPLVGNFSPRQEVNFGYFHKPHFKFHKIHKFHKFHKFPKHVKHKVGTPGHSHSAWGGYVAGATICMVAWPMINAAMGNPEPTSEEMVQHVAGCWFPPLAIINFLQDQGAF